MAVFAALTLSPSHVHDGVCQLIGHRAYWHRQPYHGGLYSTEHFRTCSFCGCIHPGDLAELLNSVGGRIEESDKPGKLFLFTPNPVAGALVRMGSIPGAVFQRHHEPQNLKHRLYGDADPTLPFEPSISERLTGHFDRPALEPAPAEIKCPFYSEHACEEQWAALVEAAATHGAKQ